MKINIRKWHILKGKRSDSNRCPIALALSGHGFIAPNVNYLRVEFYKPGTNWIKRLLGINCCVFWLSASAFYWLDTYDRAGAVGPAELEFYDGHVYIHENRSG